MSKAHLTALAAALAIGAFAPRLAAQDTSSAGMARPDTSGYTGAGGVDTSATPGRVGATDTIRVGGGDSAAAGADTLGLPGDTVTDSTGAPAASDTSGMTGRRPTPTKPGSTESPTGTTSPATSPSSTSPSGTSPSGGTSPSSP